MVNENENEKRKIEKRERDTKRRNEKRRELQVNTLTDIHTDTSVIPERYSSTDHVVSINYQSLSVFRHAINPPSGSNTHRTHSQKTTSLLTE